MDYAREGYGLEASIADSWLNEDRLVLRLIVENPGGMDIYLGDAGGVQGNLTIGETYPVHFQQTRVRAGNATTVIITIDISEADLEAIRAAGSADMSLDLKVIVPDRNLRTRICIEASDMEVRT